MKIAAASFLYLGVTLGITRMGYGIYQKLKKPWLHPVFLGSLGLTLFLAATQTPYAKYQALAGKYLQWGLSPAVIAMAWLLHQHAQKIRTQAVALMLACGLGSGLGVFSGVGLAHVFGLTHSLQAAIAPKSATSPIAMGVAQAAGGSAPLAALLVVLVGVVGATLGPVLLNRIGCSAPAKGVALGAAAHGVGTAVSIEASSEQGAYAALSMALTGIGTAFWVTVWSLLSTH